jgi:hypothetical protein
VEAATASTPTGLGQTAWPGLPKGVRVLGGAPPACWNWRLAFVDGGKPGVIVAGAGFSSYQKAVQYFSARTRGPTYFTFTNNRGTYLFCYEEVEGSRVIKICEDGMNAITRPNGVTLSPKASAGKGRGSHAGDPLQEGFGLVVEGLGQVPGVPIYAPATGIYAGLPTTPGLNWWNYCWIYIPGSGLPSNPGAAGITPPNQPTDPTGEVGSWVAGYSGEWYWFPPGLLASSGRTPYGQIVGGDGVTYNVYAQSDYATSDIGSGLTTSSYPAPAQFTASPFDPSASPGQWVLPACPDYWVWVTSLSDNVAADLGTTSGVGTAVLVGLGLLVTGGVAYAIWG